MFCTALYDSEVKGIWKKKQKTYGKRTGAHIEGR